MNRIEGFELRAPQVVALLLPPAAVIRVTAGRLWLTREGRPEDVWLCAGQRWVAGAACKVWISAEAAADFQIAQPAASKRWRLGSMQRRAGLDLAEIGPV